MAEKSDTIVALKTTFLRQQVRILSQPLRPSERWKSGEDLREEDIGNAVRRANEIVRRHNNSVYDRVAIHNVAQQIDVLYWQSTNPEDILQGEDENNAIPQGDDLTSDENIEKLSSIFPEEDSSEEINSQIQQLQELQTRRAELQRKLASYQHLEKMMEQFKDPQNSIQPNLVTRDGPLADELAKSKALGIRVAGRLAGMDSQPDGGGIDDDGDEIMIIDEDERLAAVLAME